VDNWEYVVEIFEKMNERIKKMDERIRRLEAIVDKDGLGRKKQEEKSNE